MTKEFISKAPSPSPSPAGGEGCNIFPPLRGGDKVGSTLRRGDPTRGEGDVCGLTNDPIRFIFVLKASTVGAILVFIR